jgi:hypothetical protein
LIWNEMPSTAGLPLNPMDRPSTASSGEFGMEDIDSNTSEIGLPKADGSERRLHGRVLRLNS